MRNLNPDGNGDSFEADRGALKLRLFYDPSHSQLVVRVKQGSALLAADVLGSSDPWVNVHFRSSAHAAKTNAKTKTSVQVSTLNPVWDEQLHWDVDPAHDVRSSM